MAVQVRGMPPQPHPEHSMSSSRGTAIPVCAVLMAAAVVGGCASSHLSSEPPPGVSLAGDWKLDTARSDDLGKAIERLRTQGKATHGHANGGEQPGLGGYGTRRRRGGGVPGGQPEGQPGGEAGEDQSSPGADSGAQGIGTALAPNSSPVGELMSSVPPGEYLRITVSPTAFTVISGDSSNQYTPGLESDISAEQGDATQTSGWQGADYVIDTKPQWGPEIIQTYGLGKDGRLTMTVRLTGRSKFTFTRVYDRTKRMAPLAPPTNN